jgi:hypothetical protein
MKGIFTDNQGIDHPATALWDEESSLLIGAVFERSTTKQKKLIASAPKMADHIIKIEAINRELLAALGMAEMQYTAFVEQSNEPGNMFHAKQLSKIRAAIEKAKGGK